MEVTDELDSAVFISRHPRFNTLILVAAHSHGVSPSASLTDESLAFCGRSSQKSCDLWPAVKASVRIALSRDV
jgi:hypothetical protein